MNTRENFLQFGGDAGDDHEEVRSKSHHSAGFGWLHPLGETNVLSSDSQDAILVGAMDRYGVGDLLRPHVVTRVIHFSRFRCTGLVKRDMTRVGGHSVRTIGEAALEMGQGSLQVLHLGGEREFASLTDAYALAAPAEEQERFESLSVLSTTEDLTAYVRRRTGQLEDVAYLVPDEGEFHGTIPSFHAVGLSHLPMMEEGVQTRLLEVLKSSAFVGVRDEVGADFLESKGVSVHRMPCSLSVLPQVCARQLQEHRDSAALEEIRHRFPNGWIAVELSGLSSAQLERLKVALQGAADHRGLGIVLFDSSGEASIPLLQQWAREFSEWTAAAFPSTNIWDVSSLLMHSRLYCGGSLDCRVLAMGAGIARISTPSKRWREVMSYAELWESDFVPVGFEEEEDWANAIEEALVVDLSLLQDHASKLHQCYFESLELYCKSLGLKPRLRAEIGTPPHGNARADWHHLHDEWLESSGREHEDIEPGQRKLAV